MEFEKMFEDEEDEASQGVKRISLEIIMKNNIANKNVLKDLAE
jgi:hypothetical protein